jgi:multiple sugar transport system substrate-binding protein
MQDEENTRGGRSPCIHQRGTEMNRARRNVLACAGGAGIAGAAALTAACGGSGSERGGGTGVAGLPPELSWMGWSMGQEYLLPAYEEAAGGFAAAHAGSKITLLPAGGNYREKYTALVVAGTPPDVADVHWQQHVRDVGPAGLALALDQLLKRDPYPKDYLGWEPYRWRERQYGVPSAIQSTALFYNRSLFDQAGVPYPDGSWTWEQLATTAQRLTKAGPDDDSTVWGVGDQGGTNAGWMNALFNAFGGAMFTPDYRAQRFTDKETMAAMAFRASWGSRLRIARNVAGGTSGQFTGGTLAMATSGS